MSETERSCKLNTGWNVGDTIGSQTLAGAALSSFSAGADYYREIKLGELYQGIRVIGRVKEKDREFYMVEGYPAFGSAETMYFDVQTGLLTGRDLTQQTPGGPIRLEMRYSDWRKIDGVKLLSDSEKNIHYIFHENGDGFDIVCGKSFSHVAWENVRKVIERPQYFHFIFNKYDSMIIPKRFLFHGSDEAVMKEIVVSQVGEKAKLM